MVQIVDEINGEYWRKKGYAQVGADVILPRGVWNGELDFTLISMSRNGSPSKR
jgi:hypothetical protein